MAELYRIWLHVLGLTSIGFFSPSSANGTPVILALDSRYVSCQGCQVELGPVTKYENNPLFGEDKPWEMAWWNTYPTVAYDPHSALFKLWYNSNTNCSNTRPNGMCPHLGYNYTTPSGKPGSATLLATSKDGIHFDKPNLGQYSWQGSKNNNIVLDTGDCDPNRGIFYDSQETDPNSRFKLFGSFPRAGTGNLKPGSALGTMSSADGIVWEKSTYVAVDSMEVNADTANNALYDEDVGYMAFSRFDCRSNGHCNYSSWGTRRETRSINKEWTNGNWSKGVEVLHGVVGNESYSLVPWRAPSWTPGLYFGIGSFYATTDPEGHVYCELCQSLDYGQTWTRVVPGQSFIPLGKSTDFDSHTCYAAPPILDPSNSSQTKLYYAGGHGPHSGGGVEHGRRNYIALASVGTNTIAGLKVDSDHVVANVTINLQKFKAQGQTRVSLLLGQKGKGNQTGVHIGVEDKLTSQHLTITTDLPQWNDLSFTSIPDRIHIKLQSNTILYAVRIS
eukprot:m.85750 g.85750  ORF g.85750 m.85750 type:complete len:503 (-) comp13022_c0_seq1:21-1529(-)